LWTIGQRDAAGIRSSLIMPIPSVRLTDEARRMLPASLPSKKLVDITAQSPQLDSTPRAAMVYSSTSLPHDAWIRVPHRLSGSAGRGRLAWAASSRFSAMTNALPPSICLETAGSPCDPSPFPRSIRFKIPNHRVCYRYASRTRTSPLSKKTFGGSLSSLVPMAMIE
jgi:hypothetical protein